MALASGCFGDDDDDSSSGPGGGSQALCDNFTACGGDIVGEWELIDLCIEGMDSIFETADLPPECSDMVRNMDVSVSGSVIFEEDGTEQSEMTISLDAEMVFTEACIGTLGGGSMTADMCSLLAESFAKGPSSDGGLPATSCSMSGSSCVCPVSMQQPPVSSSGFYQVEGSTITEGARSGPFCVSGDTLQIYSESSEDGISGVLVLRRR